MISARLEKIDINEAMTYLGMNGRCDDGIKGKMEDCALQIMKAAEPRIVYKRAAVHEGQIEGLHLQGNDILRITGSASEAIVMAATLGMTVDHLINRMQVMDMSAAVMLDACASAAIENICNNFEDDMRAQIQEEGLFLSERYSPGYGDLPLSLQKEVGEFLNTHRRIGLIVSDNCMMTPVKSVTAIMGITEKAVTCRIHRCETCTSRNNCSLRAARLKNESAET